MSKVIAITGPKGSGKDTVAQIIKQLYPDLKIRNLAFADPIKHTIEHIFQLPIQGVGLEDHQAYDQFKRTRLVYDLPKIGMQGIDARHVVREIGMMMRGYNEKQFNEYVLGEINKADADVYVITDLRFDNEYLMLKSIGAKIIKINRPNYDYDGHITERGFDDHLVDKTVYNDGDLQYLKTRVKIVADSIIKEN